MAEQDRQPNPPVTAPGPRGAGIAAAGETVGTRERLHAELAATTGILDDVPGTRVRAPDGRKKGDADAR